MLDILNVTRNVYKILDHGIVAIGSFVRKVIPNV